MDWRLTLDLLGPIPQCPEDLYDAWEWVPGEDLFALSIPTHTICHTVGREHCELYLGWHRGFPNPAATSSTIEGIRQAAWDLFLKPSFEHLARMKEGSDLIHLLGRETMVMPQGVLTSLREWRAKLGMHEAVIHEWIPCSIQPQGYVDGKFVHWHIDSGHRQMRDGWCDTPQQGADIINSLIMGDLTKKLQRMEAELAELRGLKSSVLC